MFLKIKYENESAIFLNTDFLGFVELMLKISLPVWRLLIEMGKKKYLMILNILESLKILWRAYSAFNY